MRPTPAALDIANYPYTTEIPVRFGDIDSLRHVNNVAIAQLFEESRVRFGMFSRGDDLEALGKQSRLVTVSTTINYLQEVFYPEPVIVAVGIREIGRTSYTLGCLMQQGGRPVAYSVTTLVRSEGGKSTPLPEALIPILEKYLVCAE